MGNFLSTGSVLIDIDEIQAAVLRKSEGAMGAIRGANGQKQICVIRLRSGSKIEITENAEETFAKIQRAVRAVKS